MSRWCLKLRKILFELTPKRLRSPFCRDNPWLANYKIGEWTYGSPKVLDWGTGAQLEIGRFCSIGGGVTIFLDGEHHTEWVTTYPLSSLLSKTKKVTNCVRSKGDLIIGNDVWIGDEATILSGVRIGNGAVVGARALVVKHVEPYSIIAGNPARLVRKRFTAEQISALERIAWWDWPIERVKEAMPLLTSSSIDDFIRTYA